jgi:hypothetical protein
MNNIFRRSTWLFLSIFSGLLTYAQGITGIWNGSLHVQPKDIPIVFHIVPDSSGKLIAAFDSPSQNAFGLPVSEVITKEDSVILMIAILGGKYAGVLGGDKKTINGMWYQGKGSLPLTIAKTSNAWASTLDTVMFQRCILLPCSSMNVYVFIFAHFLMIVFFQTIR